MSPRPATIVAERPVVAARPRCIENDEVIAAARVLLGDLKKGMGEATEGCAMPAAGKKGAEVEGA
jgi:hypothetical protein